MRGQSGGDLRVSPGDGGPGLRLLLGPKLRRPAADRLPGPEQRRAGRPSAAGARQRRHRLRLRQRAQPGVRAVGAGETRLRRDGGSTRLGKMCTQNISSSSFLTFLFSAFLCCCFLTPRGDTTGFHVHKKTLLFFFFLNVLSTNLDVKTS